MKWMRLSAAGLAILLALTGAFVLAPTPSTYAQLEDVIARVKPAVVVVRVKDVLGGGGHGSGFIYDPSGFVLTNHHVTEGAVEITVTLPDQRSFPATVVDYIRRNGYACPPRVDTWVDAAVLKINGTGLPTIAMGDSGSLRQGQDVLVLGYPGGVGTEEVSVSRGIVGGVRSGWFQTDATIIPGNSGGPVIDRQGRVVGLAAFGVGQYFRIGGVVAINAVRPMADSAVASGPRAQEFRITGLEYIPTVTVGRRRVFRQTYDPGAAGGQPSVRNYSTDVTQVQNFSGSFLYTVRSSDGSESRNFLDADGLHAIGSVSPNWKTTDRWPAYSFAFPSCVGTSWQREWRAENAAEGIVRQATASVRIESVNESVTVPAGSYSQVIRMVTLTQGQDVRGNQSRAWQETETSWWAPGVGEVRSVTENPATRQRWVDELVGTEAGPPQASPPPPTPTPSEVTPAPPPPQVAKPLGSNDRQIVPGDRVGPARIGTSLDDVIRIVGEAPQVYASQHPGQPTGWIGYQWSTHLYVVIDKETRIIRRAGVWAPRPDEIAQPPYRFTGGVGLGSTEGEIRAVFGTPDIRDQGETSVFYMYNAAGIGFYIGSSRGYLFNGQVFELFVFEPGSFK